MSVLLPTAHVPASTMRRTRVVAGTPRNVTAPLSPIVTASTPLLAPGKVTAVAKTPTALCTRVIPRASPIKIRLRGAASPPPIKARVARTVSLGGESDATTATSPHTARSSEAEESPQSSPSCSFREPQDIIPSIQDTPRPIVWCPPSAHTATHQGASAAVSQPIVSTPGRVVASTSLRAPVGPCCSRQVDESTGEKSTVVVDETGCRKTYDQDLAVSFVKGAFSMARAPAFDVDGNPLEKVREIVRDKDGHVIAFGSDSIYDEAVMKRWVASLNSWHLKGFEKELVIRVSDIYKEYSSCKEQLEDFMENADYIFFGLDKDATLEDLQKAFRRLARLMHPDKNGGSDEAKARFQDLKERYEALKKKILGEGADDEDQKELLDEGQDLDENRDKNGCDEDDLDRDQREKKIWELYYAAQAMQKQIRSIKAKLDSEGTPRS